MGQPPETTRADARRAAAEEDPRLVERTLAGESRAFEILFERYRERVYAVSFGYVRDKEEALDITQEAFVRAYEKLASFRGRSSFFTWVTQIAINRSIDMVRKRKRRRTIQLEDHHEGARRLAAAKPLPGPGQGVLDDELRERYEAALAELTEKHRTVFVLHTVKDMAYKEIAALLEISIGTVMSRLHYARKRLQSLLAGYLDSPARKA